MALESYNVPVNMSGEAPGKMTPRAKLKVGEHKGKFLSVEAIEAPAYDNPNVKEPKLVFLVGIGDVDLPFYVNPRVSKGSGSYSNSKLYDVLEALDLLEDFSSLPAVKENKPIALPALVKFLEDKVIGKVARVGVKNSKKGTPEEYSTVREVYGA